jgi:hypothetical protein
MNLQGGNKVLGEHRVVMLLSVSGTSEKLGSNRTRPYAARDRLLSALNTKIYINYM